jgi:hypothetical protein
MKSFKDYLTESKKTYDFKVKIAGDCPKDCVKKIKEALSMYSVESCSSGKRTPIQETQSDFPEQKNISVTIFDVCLSYPTTSAQVRAAVCDKLRMYEDKVKVRNIKEEEEIAINNANKEKSGESLFNKDYEVQSENQNLVGDKRVMSMLKDLTSSKRELEQYSGVNDQLFAKQTKGKK